MKCEMCGENSDKLYTVPFAEDYDEEGHAVVANYNVCPACVPKEIAESCPEMFEGQEMMCYLMR